jgi:sirohydrochlorin ferrochelatase
MTRAILLVDHGSRKPAANELLEQVAEQIRTREPAAIVVAAHLEIAEPDIPSGIALCVEAGATEVVVHPYFLGPGRHTTSDIPRIVEEASAAHPDIPIRVTPPLGPHDKLVDVVLERIAQTLR